MSRSVAIVDYGLGNLFSVQQACAHAGMRPIITSSISDVVAADVVVLPGVGAFGDAMDALRSLDLIGPLREVPSRGGLLFGICLGMQLLMSESCEFGRHEGLGLIEGDVVRFEPEDDRTKVPHIGWAPVEFAASWSGSPLASLPQSSYMYFLHSYYVRPSDESLVLSTTRFGGTNFCSSLWCGNIFAAQFHPERSGQFGLRIYEEIAQSDPIKGVTHAGP